MQNADAFWKPGCGIQTLKCYDGIVGHTVLFEVLPSPLARGASGTVYHLRDKSGQLGTWLVSSIFQL